ncbi:MAG: Ig-like domain-containing protein, partial [Verrucomicrobiota bacterium]
MKTAKTNSFVFALAALLAAGSSHPAIAQTVAFSWPTNGQAIVTLAGLTGTAQTGTNTIRSALYAIYDQSTGQWWNGTNYQGGQVWLAASVHGSNWAPASGARFPAIYGGQYYQLAAQLTDSANNVVTTNITVEGDPVPPVITFAPLSGGQVVSDLSAIGGSATDSYTTVASVVFTIQELDINGGPGRWWSGSNYQATAVPLAAAISAGRWSPATGVGLPSLNSGQSYALTATAVDALSNSASTNITVTDAMTVLGWDPGLTAGGTVLLANPNTNGGNYWFQINPESPVVGVWRTALNVLAGEADVYLEQGSPPRTYSYNFASANAGSNGFVVDASQYSPGQNWYILVSATSNAQWTLLTGDVFVYKLGSLAADSSSSTNAPIGAEGMIFFQTTIPSTTLAWQLWIHGAANQMYVKKSAAPDPASYDLTQAGQMLVVPPYLAGGTFNGTYFTGVLGAPGTPINLDSRQQPIIPLAFTSTTNVTVGTTDFPYVTYQIQVPVQQIAWQLNLTPASGNPSIAVRRDLVPNEFRNDAFSEVPQGVGASVSLVPPPPNSGSGTPGLSDGTWYVTIYSTAPYSCAFVNANPVITTVDYLFSITNDAPNRAGWRYYQVTDIADQLGTLGWALWLSNQVPGTEVAIRRNAVPGQWNYRNYDDYYWISSLGYVDLASTYGLLQQPGHQADIWYIGVYTPDQALGNFVLTGSQLTG